MSLSAKYEAFLARPTADALADDAALHYVTTLTSINTAPAITKHFAVQEKLLKRKGDKVLGSIESDNGLSIELETTLEFVNGGGAYLPGLDDNFVADRTVSFPMVHMVQFDDKQKISQVRMYWDQASLLKQVDVIGARARNWPIRDAKDQVRLITSSAGASNGQDAAATGASSRRSTASRGPDDVTITERPASSRSATSATKDPHASLNLFQPRDATLDEEAPSYAQPIAPRQQSAKPPPREYSELFAGADVGSPSPANVATPRIPKKAGSGRVHANRLFDEDEEPAPTPLSVKTNAKKFNHFDFGDGEDAEVTPKAPENARSKRSKHQSQWDFEDFATPEQTRTKVLGQQVRHFGWSDDEEETSPIQRPIVHKARPDADAHFEITDEATPAAARHAHHTSKGRLHNKGLGLYQDHVTNTTADDDEDTAYQGENKDATTVVKNENRKKDFGSQFSLQDDSPAGNEKSSNGASNRVPEDRKKVLKSLDPHWNLYEESPEPKERKIYKTAGNGMGGRKGTEAHWMFGEGDENALPNNGAGIKATGNGMGARKGTESEWSLGDENAEFGKTFETPARPKAKAEGKGSFNWDF